MSEDRTMADQRLVDGPAAGERAAAKATGGEPAAGEPAVDATLDGNAAAGVLAATFGVEMTATPGSCAHCGTVSLVGALRAYVRGPGIVLRCGVCGEVVLRVVQTPTAILVDASGAAWLRFPSPVPISR